MPKMKALIISWCVLFISAWGMAQTLAPSPTPRPSPRPKPTPAPVVAPRLIIEYPPPSLVINSTDVEIFLNCTPSLPEGYAFRVILNNDLPIHHEDARKPVILSNLKSGGHFVRAYVVNSKGLALRNADSFASVQFFIQRRDFANTVPPASPMITVNLPAELMTFPDEHHQVAFDFLIHHAPLNPQSGYQIRCVLNNITHYYDKSETAYWKDLPPGKHRAIIHLLDPSGQPVLGAFNHVEREFQISQVLKPLPATTPPPLGQQMFVP